MGYLPQTVSTQTSKKTGVRFSTTSRYQKVLLGRDGRRSIPQPFNFFTLAYEGSDDFCPVKGDQ